VGTTHQVCTVALIPRDFLASVVDMVKVLSFALIGNKVLRMGVSRVRRQCGVARQPVHTLRRW
jgi:hypothetical protein